MYTKKNARVTFRSNRRSGFKRNNNFSNGKGRNKGNITQQYNKYLNLAKEAFTSGDRIQSEYYYQFTDHYYRLMVELGINIDESQINLDGKINSSLDNQATQSSNEQETNIKDNNTNTGWQSIHQGGTKAHLSNSSTKQPNSGGLIRRMGCGSFR